MAKQKPVQKPSESAEASVADEAAVAQASAEPEAVPQDNAEPDAASQDNAEPEAPKAPQKLTLARPHGFIDEHGTHRYWTTGQVVTHPEEVALLLERKAAVLES